MSTCVHPRFSWGYLVLIISSFFAAMYFFSLSLSSPVSVALGCLFLIALLIYSNVYCHSHFIPHIFPCPCHLWIVYSRLPYRFSLTFIAIAISFPPPFLSLSVSTLDCLFLIALSISSNVYCHSHFISPFLSSSVSTLDCLFFITFSMVSNVYYHSYFIRPFLSLSVSTLDCLFLITLSIFSNVYCHIHFIPPFLSCSCQLWIVYT
jgi:hypothetical protein